MYIDQKVQEICLALIKISVYVRRIEFRRSLERLSFRLLEEVGMRDTELMLKTSMALENMIRFGRTIYEIEPVNSDILIQEIAKLNSAIRQIDQCLLPNSGIEKELPNIESVFSEKQIPDSSIEKEEDKPNKSSAKAGKGAETEVLERSRKARDSQRGKSAIPNIKKTSEEGNENPTIRQHEIVETIRQFGNKPAKLKDISAEFPNFSERTLRYDLQRLCNQGILEKMGTGGPGTHYKLRVI